MRCTAVLYWLCALGLAAAASGCAAAAPDQTPLRISPQTLSGLQLLLFIKNVEVDFFSRLPIAPEQDPASIITRLDMKTIGDQDKMHRDALRRIVQAAGDNPGQPCSYIAPPSDAREYVAAGRLLKSAGVSAALGVAESVAGDDMALLPGLLAMAATESRHSTMMEVANGSPASPSAFGTAIPEAWAYNVFLEFVTPGSCPDLPPLAIMPSLLMVVGNNNASFSWDPEQAPVARAGQKPLSIAWVNQLGAPVYTKLTSTGPGNGTTVLPTVMNGSVYAVLTSQEEAASLTELVGLTLAGPAVRLDV